MKDFVRYFQKKQSSSKRDYDSSSEADDDFDFISKQQNEKLIVEALDERNLVTNKFGSLILRVSPNVSRETYNINVNAHSSFRKIMKSGARYEINRYDYYKDKKENNKDPM